MNTSVLLSGRFSGLEVIVLKGEDVAVVLRTEVSASWRSKINEGKRLKSALYFYNQFFTCL